MAKLTSDRRPAAELTPAAVAFLAARNSLFEHRGDLLAARAAFRWPRVEGFNWTLDYFDAVPPSDAVALSVVSSGNRIEESTYGELSRRSSQVANYLRNHGLKPGDAILVCLDNVTPLWETMLAAIRANLVVIPASPLLTGADLDERIARGNARAVVAGPEVIAAMNGGGSYVRIAVGAAVEGWQDYDDSRACDEDFIPPDRPAPSDPLLLYFTSGTTANPKLVEHTHTSYPVGHLSTMYALGLRPGDVHLNVSSPGWAKHAWSCLFAPWNAEATVIAFNYARFDPRALLSVLVDRQVTSLCAPPTVWRMLVQQPLASYAVGLRELLSAGEPLNPEVIQTVRSAWGLTIRDFYGQTETTALVANSPGQEIRAGSMGRPLPGYEVDLLDADGQPADEGEICVRLSGETPPAGIMTGYRDDGERTRETRGGSYFRTGDVATRDADGYIQYIGRADDIFKASDYRISPFELESILIEHPSVAEAAVVPSPDPHRTAVPKAYVALTPEAGSDAETARAILAHSRARMAPYKRVRRVEFAELPKTISGKIRRAELRAAEEARGEPIERRPLEFWESDFAD